MGGQELGSIEVGVVQVRRGWLSIEEIRCDCDEASASEAVGESTKVVSESWAVQLDNIGDLQLILGEIDAKDVGEVEDNGVFRLVRRRGDISCHWSSQKPSCVFS